MNWKTANKRKRRMLQREALDRKVLGILNSRKFWRDLGRALAQRTVEWLTTFPHELERERMRFDCITRRN